MSGPSDSTFGNKNSAFGKSDEIALSLPVRAHSLYRVLPAVLHFPQSRFVGVVTRGDDFVQVLVLALMT